MSAALVAGEESEEELPRLPVVSRTPFPVPTEVASEDESPHSQEVLEGLAEPVPDSSNFSSASVAKDVAEAENDIK